MQPVARPGRKTKVTPPGRGSAAPHLATPSVRLTGSQRRPFRLRDPAGVARPGHATGSRLGDPEAEVWWRGHNGSEPGAGACERSLREAHAYKDLYAVAPNLWWTGPAGLSPQQTEPGRPQASSPVVIVTNFRER